MLKEAIAVGQRFRWTKIGGDRSSGTAVVLEIRSDEQEGMSPEVEDYAAAWIEAEGQSGAREHKHLTVLLGTDGKSYLEGDEISVELTGSPIDA